MTTPKLADSATMISGIRRPYASQGSLIRRDVADKIFMLDPSADPFIVMTSQLKKKKAIASKIEWFTDVLNPMWDQVNCLAGYAAGDVAIVVDNGSYWNAYDLAKNMRSGEIMLVSTTPAANTLTVVRGYGTTAAAAISDNDWLRRLPNALDDGIDTLPGAKSTISTQLYNYLQEFSYPVKISRRDKNTEVYTEDDELYQLRKAGIESNRMIESQCIYGEPYMDVGAKDTSANERYLTGGLFYYCTSNQALINGKLSESALISWLRDVFTHNSSPGRTRVLFASPLLNSCISEFAGNKLITVEEDQIFGIAIRQYKCAHGTVKIVEEPLLEGDYYGGSGFAVDMSELEFRYLQNMDMHLDKNIQNKQAHNYLHEYTGTLGITFGNVSHHGTIMGVTGPA